MCRVDAVVLVGTNPKVSLAESGVGFPGFGCVSARINAISAGQV